MRTIYINLYGPNGQQFPARTPLAFLFFSDAEADQRPYHSGVVEENGRLAVRLDGLDPPNSNGVNYSIIAPGCKPATGRGIITGNEFILDSGQEFIRLEEGSNPFA